jgi:hypothetical protein
VSTNTALTDLDCQENQLTSLDVSTNTVLIHLYCSINQLTSLDVSTNTVLIHLYCLSNQLTSLDVSTNTALIQLWCQSNQLTSIDVRNTNNQNMTYFKSQYNSSLTCINVDDSSWSTNNWIIPLSGYFNFDVQHYFSNNCNGSTAIEEHSTNKELLKVIDLLGRETPYKKRTPLFYIYDDGTVEKRIVIE